MNGQTKTLIAIALFVAFCFGSFVWFLVSSGASQGAKAAATILPISEAV